MLHRLKIIIIIETLAILSSLLLPEVFCLCPPGMLPHYCPFISITSIMTPFTFFHGVYFSFLSKSWRLNTAANTLGKLIPPGAPWPSNSNWGTTFSPAGTSWPNVASPIFNLWVFPLLFFYTGAEKVCQGNEALHYSNQHHVVTPGLKQCHQPIADWFPFHPGSAELMESRRLSGSPVNQRHLGQEFRK